MTTDDGDAGSRMRISDADRDRAAAILSDALAEGRLTADEHAHRLDLVYAAKTQAEIAPIVSDLPGAAAALARPDAWLTPRSAGLEPGGGDDARVVGIFSSVSRRGPWRASPRIRAVAVFGDVGLDFQEVTLTARETQVRAVSVFGSITLTVPPEVHVTDTGLALFGGREVPPDTEASAGPDAPVLRVSGVSVFGLLTVRRDGRRR